MNIFWGMKILWKFFGHHKIGLVLGVISISFRVFFFKVNVQNGDNFLGYKNFKYFLGCLIFLIFFGVNS